MNPIDSLKPSILYECRCNTIFVQTHSSHRNCKINSISAEYLRHLAKLQSPLPHNRLLKMKIKISANEKSCIKKTIFNNSEKKRVQ